MPVKFFCSLLGVVGLLFSSGPLAFNAQTAGEPRCYTLNIEDPRVLFMLRREVQGEVMVLTDEPLVDSPGVTDGTRAYLGEAEWRRRGPLRPFSWYWTRTASDSVKVGFVLPLWGIIWTAVETPEGLAGVVTFHSDAVGEPSESSRFVGIRVQCASTDSSEHAV